MILVVQLGVSWEDRPRQQRRTLSLLVSNTSKRRLRERRRSVLVSKSALKKPAEKPGERRFAFWLPVAGVWPVGVDVCPTKDDV